MTDQCSSAAECINPRTFYYRARVKNFGEAVHFAALLHCAANNITHFTPRA